MFRIRLQLHCSASVKYTSTAGLHVQNTGAKQWTLQLYLIQNLMKEI